MRILLVNHFPLEGSGSGTYTRNIAQHLAKRGNEVCVVFPENQEPTPLPGVKLYPVYFDETGENPKGLPNPLPFNFPCFTTHPRSLTTFDDLTDEQVKLYLDAFSKKTAEAIEEFEPEIIHAQHVWLLADMAARTGKPTVITAHGTDMMGYRKWPRFHPYADEAVELCRCIIAISKDNFNDTVETIPAAADKMVLLLNGYNEDIFYREDIDLEQLLASYEVPYDGQKLVLFAGKLTNFKGVDTLLRAIARYEKEHPDIITLLAGSGEELDNLLALKDELGLERTYFLGHQSQDDLRKLYNIADLFVMPSRREPFGLVALEAMACGLPVVATNQGGLPEFVSPDVGSLVDVDDVEGLADAIIAELARTAEIEDRRSYIADKIFENYAQSKFVVRLEALYQKVLDES